MKHSILLFVTMILLLSLKSQIIDYGLEQISETSCNIFASPKAIDGYEHRTVLGRPRYSDNSILLECINKNSSTVGSTIYSLKYNFKSGFNYRIHLNFRGVKTSGDAFEPTVGLKFESHQGSITTTNCIPPTDFPNSTMQSFSRVDANASYVWKYNVINWTPTQAFEFCILEHFHILILHL